jgi:hypothetical protein
MKDALWFYWGGDHLTFLRWATLASACQMHPRVILVRRRHDPDQRRAALDAARTWHERQDFQEEANGRNWMSDLPAGIQVMWLDEVAPEIAAVQAPDVQTSDLLGWWLLANHGGTVADMDVVFIRSLPVVEADVQIVVCSGWPKVGYMPIGFLQGRPCDYWRSMYRRARERYDPRIYESCGAGLFLPWDQIPESKRLLPESIVYPFALKAEWGRWHAWMFQSPEWPDIPEECCGIHWYGGNNQRFNRAITADNIEDWDGAVPWAVRQMLAKKEAQCA